jgi:hypothetical protein
MAHQSPNQALERTAAPAYSCISDDQNSFTCGHARSRRRSLSLFSLDVERVLSHRSMVSLSVSCYRCTACLCRATLRFTKTGIHSSGTSDRSAAHRGATATQISPTPRIQALLRHVRAREHSLRFGIGVTPRPVTLARFGKDRSLCRRRVCDSICNRSPQSARTESTSVFLLPRVPEVGRCGTTWPKPLINRWSRPRAGVISGCIT